MKLYRAYTRDMTWHNFLGYLPCINVTWVDVLYRNLTHDAVIAYFIQLQLCVLVQQTNWIVYCCAKEESLVLCKTGLAA